MADQKTSGLAEALTIDAADLVQMVDVSDLSMAPTGTNKKILKSNLLTKSNVGLANVNNTADSAKPVSTAQQAAIDAKIISGNYGGAAPGVSPSIANVIAKDLDDPFNWWFWDGSTWT